MIDNDKRKLGGTMFKPEMVDRTISTVAARGAQ